MELKDIFSLYQDTRPTQWTSMDTSHGEADFRQAVFAQWGEEKLVIKITCNDFTTPHRVKCWKETIDAYISAEYYCPRIVDALDGECVKTIEYEGKKCVVYAEEYARYGIAENRDEVQTKKEGKHPWREAALKSIGVIGRMHLETADFNLQELTGRIW